MSVISHLFAAFSGGGLWNLYLHWRSRTFEKRLLIDVHTEITALKNKRIVSVEVALTNAGKGMLKAMSVGPGDYVYQDENERLKSSCGLQIKRIATEKLAGECQHLDWFNSPALEEVPGIPDEINLLDDYAVPSDGNKIVFWLEPGDVAHLYAPMILPVGAYLMKVSFYGTNFQEDYWSRLVCVSVD